MSEDPKTGCGISWLWMTSPDDPLAGPCSWHDAAYTEGAAIQHEMTRREVDRYFRKQMLGVSRGFWDRARAYLYFGVARVVGRWYWEGK